MKTIISLLILFSCYKVSAIQAQAISKTKITVVELKNYSFTAESFFEEKKDLTFEEITTSSKFHEWSQEAVDLVNQWVTKNKQLPEIKIKLIFEAYIKNKLGKVQLTPISIIESYQEPQTQSIRMGMFDQKEDQLTFKLTIAHEYAHLIFENASRKAGAMNQQSDQINFWPKSVYEGVADYLMSIALELITTAHPNHWSARRLDAYNSLQNARKAKSTTIQKAKNAFVDYGLVPTYPIYQDWLNQISVFIQNLGGADPYAEGTWVAGSLLTIANEEHKKQKLVEVIIKKAESGQKYKDPKEFIDDIQKILSNY